MTARIRHITFDCSDPFVVSRFWAAVLGYVDDPDDVGEPGDEEVGIVDPTGRHPGLLFIAVPEPKSAKNRIHLDVQPSEARDVAVEAIVSLGGTVVDDRRRSDGSGWVVVADPEGNELCVERSAAERGDVPLTSEGEDQDFPPQIRTAGEMEMLTDMLEWYRAAVIRKVVGISQVHAKMSPVRSGTTVAGVLKHLAGVEDSWFDDRFAGSPEPEPWASAPLDENPDWDFSSALDDDLEELLDLYRTACERSRRAAADHGLDDLAANSQRPFNLRFAYVHLIEETARHLGHMDILREFLDGSIGE